MLVFLSFTLIVLTPSCNKADDPVLTTDPVYSVPTEPKVTSKSHDDKYSMTIYNIEYPSTDPFGYPVTLSGTITVGDEVTAATPSTGIVLINHFTVYQKDECPSKGDLMIQKVAVGSGLVAVSPDLYGFGSSESKHQAYCMGMINAQAGIDALIAARKLIPTLEISFAEGKENQVFNIGYSQGGQTAIAVLKLAAEKYPDIHFTHTFAGAGPYDIPETYRSFISADQTGMPSTVVSVLVAFDEFYNLGIPWSEMFKSPVLENIDTWFLSKDFTRAQIDEKIGSLSFSSFATPAVLNLESDLSKRLMTAFERENLCKEWTPDKNEKIDLIYHSKDITVPPVNTEHLYNYLVNELKMSTDNVKKVGESVSAFIDEKTPRHEAGAIDFAFDLLNVLNKNYGFPVWVDFSKLQDLI